MERPRTLGELKVSGYTPRSVKEELRANLRRRLKEDGPIFPGIIGYDDSVIPGIAHAVLSRHNFILLGLRGQAKSRILRALVELLDDEIPVIEGSEVNDDPLAPISRFGRVQVEEQGDDTPVRWVGRDSRYVEKLATPDVTVADLIGDLDPIRAARGGHLLSDELNIHFGLLPRANRGIFALNELPDLAGKVQVALFNVMQEGDVQIKGFPVRLPLDVQLVFTANPEDYTARGKIITPLKDRVGSEVITHYPRDLGTGIAITDQEAWLDREIDVVMPAFVKEIVERVAFAARADKRVDQRSGVSQRMPITVTENAVSAAERRALLLGEEQATVRPADIYAALPSITGKLELEYEGELQGAERIAFDLIAEACEATFEEHFREEDATPVIEYFDLGGMLRISEMSRGGALVEGFSNVTGLLPLVEASGIVAENACAEEVAAACELVLEALHAKRRISRTASGYERRTSRRRPGAGDSPFSGGLA
ncbi:MAG: sigma 54-interacting transcriptional regulator [Gemmatimonadales bacterium]|jgi:magnesium chelatase subunit I